MECGDDKQDGKWKRDVISILGALFWDQFRKTSTYPFKDIKKCFGYGSLVKTSERQAFKEKGFNQISLGNPSVGFGVPRILKVALFCTVKQKKQKLPYTWPYGGGGGFLFAFRFFPPFPEEISVLALLTAGNLHILLNFESESPPPSPNLSKVPKLCIYFQKKWQPFWRRQRI